jgi:pSer/pThr/pTyr-binding forkhead associated (FHA) protein
MRVILEVIAGPELGRIVRMAEHELRQFGRTDWADVSFPADVRMSQVHFALETDVELCRIRDLESANGIEVNGERVAEHVLADGDKIVAGTTTFRVRIEGGADKSKVATEKAVVAAAAPKLPPSIPKGAVTFTSEPCATGLTLYRGSVEQLSAMHLADLLARQEPLYLLVDFRKLKGGLPADLTNPDFLFDWLPPEAAKAASPVILAAAAYKEYGAIIDQAWGEDAVVCLYSRQDPIELRAQLRTQAQGAADSVVGYCWPSVLGPLLSFYRPQFVNKLLSGIDAVLVEFADLPDTWQIYAKEDFGATLEKFGLVREPMEEAAAEKK